MNTVNQGIVDALAALNDQHTAKHKINRETSSDEDITTAIQIAFIQGDKCLLRILNNTYHLETINLLKPLCLLIQNFSMVLENEKPVPNGEKIFYTRAQNAILNHLDQSDFGPLELSAALKMSRGHLHRKIKSLYGCKTTDFIHSIRIQMACILLQEKSLVKEIAYEVGYKDPSYFARIFTRFIGLSPKSYLRSKMQCPRS